MEREFKRPYISSYSSSESSSNSSSTSSNYIDEETRAKIIQCSMNARKSVSEGYNKGQRINFSGNYQRIPLPSNLNNIPPMLSSSESTRTLSNLEEWDSYFQINNAPIQTLESFNENGNSSSFNLNGIQNPLKRKFQDNNSNDLKNYTTTNNNDNQNFIEPEIAKYQAKYGALSFNDDF
ncbi:DIF1 [Candida pseudojiufengensis]|uniref:DIF1 n=1 Tax=Candida pseudojiufengensis TaxID=497109 RepID=UPI0022251B77|nr:DIF1 [Candida pseudojiufengensis]KAI5959376.1 DIF1 [Candida pseudojiufengensis]